MSDFWERLSGGYTHVLLVPTGMVIRETPGEGGTSESMVYVPCSREDAEAWIDENKG